MEASGESTTMKGCTGPAHRNIGHRGLSYYIDSKPSKSKITFEDDGDGAEAYQNFRKCMENSRGLSYYSDRSKSKISFENDVEITFEDDVDGVDGSEAYQNHSATVENAHGSSKNGIFGSFSSEDQGDFHMYKNACGGSCTSISSFSSDRDTHDVFRAEYLRKSTARQDPSFVRTAMDFLSIKNPSEKLSYNEDVHEGTSVTGATISQRSLQATRSHFNTNGKAVDSITEERKESEIQTGDSRAGRGVLESLSDGTSLNGNARNPHEGIIESNSIHEKGLTAVKAEKVKEVEGVRNEDDDITRLRCPMQKESCGIRAGSEESLQKVNGDSRARPQSDCDFDKYKKDGVENQLHKTFRASRNIGRRSINMNNFINCLQARKKDGDRIGDASSKESPNAIVKAPLLNEESMATLCDFSELMDPDSPYAELMEPLKDCSEAVDELDRAAKRRGLSIYLEYALKSFSENGIEEIDDESVLDILSLLPDGNFHMAYKGRGVDLGNLVSLDCPVDEEQHENSKDKADGKTNISPYPTGSELEMEGIDFEELIKQIDEASKRAKERFNEGNYNCQSKSCEEGIAMSEQATPLENRVSGRWSNHFKKKEEGTSEESF